MMSKKGPSLFSRFKFTAAAAVIVLIVFAASVPMHQYLPQQETNAVSDTAGEQETSLSDVPMTMSGLPEDTSTDRAEPEAAGAPGTGDAAKQKEGESAPAGVQNTTNTDTKRSGRGKTSAPPAPQAQSAPDTTNSAAAESSDEPSGSQTTVETKTVQLPQAPTVSQPDTDAVEQPASGGGSASPSKDMAAAAPEKNDAESAEYAKEAPSEADASAAPAEPPVLSGAANMMAAPDETQGSAETEEQRAMPPVPYQEEFAFVLVLYQCEIPESLQKQQAELYENNLYFIVDSSMKSAVVNDARSEGIDFTLLPGENSNVPHGLVIIVNS